VSKITKEFLIKELYRWIEEHDGDIPSENDMLVRLGYPSSYQYEKLFNTKRWNIVLEKVGIFSPNNKIWEEHEIEFLKQNYNKLSDSEISKELNRSVGGVRSKRNELGLLIASKKQPWLNWEIKYLKDNFFDACQGDIEKTLSHRKWETIRAYATKSLKLKRARFGIDNYTSINTGDLILKIPKNHKKAWTKENNLYIIDNYLNKTDKELADELHRTTAAVQRHRTMSLKLYRNIKENKFGSLNKNKHNNKIILLSKDKKYRKCKICKIWFPNTNEYFYKDKSNTLRTICKDCNLYNQQQERESNGSVTQRLIAKNYKKGISYCSNCNEWKDIDDFYINPNGKPSSYCYDCRKLKYVERYYGKDNIDRYNEIQEKYADKTGDRCDSLPEVLITNWLIDNNIKYKKQPCYKDYIVNDNSRRRFDWIITDNNNKFYVEYFGLWDLLLASHVTLNYTQKAKKKIKDLYKAGVINNCIFIFPYDLENKTLDEIFGEYIDINKKAQ